MVPQFALVSQSVSRDEVENISQHVQAQLDGLPLSALVKPGMRIAIGVGSRGISCVKEVVSTLVGALVAAGAKPFLVPAMGSHGGGTSEGQRQVLIGYGLGPDELGVAIESDMAALEIGTTARGMPVYFDANAAAADAIFIVNRIKPHTAFRNRWESGLFKMLSVGLGKQAGAATIHAAGIRDAMPEAARVIVSRLPVVAGIAIVENGLHGPAQIEVIPGNKIEEREPTLLEAAWRHMPRIPIEPLDLLILEEIGKDISGTGMDVNVIGLWRRTGGVVSPQFGAIVALDVTDASHGNGIGVGYADVIPQRLRDKLDLEAMYTNCLTARNYSGAKIPITKASDCEAIEAALPPVNAEAARVIIARNTRDLSVLMVSEALLDAVRDLPTLTQVSALKPLEFDRAGKVILPWA